MEVQKRKSYLDIAKGFGIIFVILGHLDVGMLNTWLYSFDLPLFFIVAGICFNPNYDFISFLRKKLRRCLIPYAFFGLFIVYVESKTGYLYERRFKRNLNRILVQERYSTLWFLATLLIAYILFYGIVRLCRQNPIIVLGISLPLSVVFVYLDQNHIRALYWNIDTAFIVLGFMALGYFLNNFKGSLDAILAVSGWKRILLITALLILNLVCYVGNMIVSERSLEMYWNSYGFYPLMYGAAVFGTMFILLISNAIKLPALEKLGKNSMTYFALHQSVVMQPLALLFARTIFVHNAMELNMIIKKTVIFILTLAICFAVDSLIRLTKLRVILGE